MNSSDNFGLNLPEQTDSYDVEHMNENTRAIDTLLNERMAVKTITVDKNLNTMRESGIYFLSQNNTHTNMPPSCTNGWLIVMNNAGNVKQIFLRRGSSSTHSNSYSRLLSGTGDLIGDWVRYLSELELGLFTDLDLDPQATDVVQALNDLYSYCVNQFANKNHTHNYAGSSSAGGSATSAVKLQTARTIRTNLQSTSTASFDGTANVTPGVTGVLPVENGGTGQTTLANAEKALLTSLNTSNDALIEDGNYIPVLTQSGGGGVTSYIATKRSPSTFWDYIVNKISVNLGLTASRYFGKSAGITGVLPVANGGTGTDTLSDAFKTLSKSQDLITDQPVNDEDRIMIEYEVVDNNYSFVRTSVTKLAEYIKNKIGNATASTAGLMSASDKSKLNNIACKEITMSSLDLKGKTSSVADFFNALNTKGYNTNYGVLYFAYGNAQAGSITGSGITISINGCQCIITNHGAGGWQRRNAIISIRDKTYNVWAQYDSNSTPSESGIVDLSANTWRPVQNNLTSTSTSDCLSAYQGKLLNEKVQLLEGADNFKLTNNSYIKIKGNVVTLYSYGGASTTSALNSLKLQSKYRPLYPIHIAGYICRVGYSSRYPAYLSIGSDGVMGVYYMQQVGGDAIYHNGTDYWFDGCGTWLNQTS